MVLITTEKNTKRCCWTLAETVLGIFAFDRTVWQTKGQEVVDGIKEKQNERCASRSWYEMKDSTKPSSHQTTELVAYHKVKRIFLNLVDIDKEDSNQLLMCEFNGQNFELFEIKYAISVTCY